MTRNTGPTIVTMLSGGIGSWMAGRRAIEQHPDAEVIHLFADTLVEDADTYRFRDDAAANLGGQLVVVADGRTPFEVFHDDHFLGNARLANCSKYLKLIPCRQWLEANTDPANTLLVVGIDWTEQHRLPAIIEGWKPWNAIAPLSEPPYIAKMQMVDLARREGLEPPAAYADGLPHSNCLAQGCVRGGQAYWEKILRTRPDVYAATEQAEHGIRATDWGADAAMLRDRTGGESTPLTLTEFRERVTTVPTMFDADEWGGCGCFTDLDGAA